MNKFLMLILILLQDTTYCFQVQLTGPKYVRRNETIHVICWSNKASFGLTADFLVNGKTYTSLRSTDSGCYSAHLRTRCPSHSIVCYCDKDGKKYGLFIQSSTRTNSMNVICLMKFKNGGHISQSNDLIVKVYDPPTLSIKENIQCNISSSVEIICDSLGVAVIYDDWYHSFNGSFVKKMTGEHIGSRSTISIASCGIKDVGAYMCKAGYTIENETFWMNVSTNLEFHGPPIPFETHGTTKPTKFTIVFYSSAQAIIIKWYKDGVTLENSTEFELMTNIHNISVDSDGVPMVLRGYKTSLTIKKRLSGVYTVLLRNDLGEYEHQFSIPAGKRGFSLQTFMWILICIGVFLINSTIATLTRRRRSRRSLKRSGNIGTIGIYYAAPSTTESASQYNSTTPQNDTEATDNATSSLYAEIIDEQVQQEESDEISHHYIELE